MRKLTLASIATFRELIEDGYVYVDKTGIIYDMISKYKVVFFSRPRRFGKSLTCSTLCSIFEGQSDLFKGLAIHGSDWNWKEYPVFYLTFAGGNYIIGKSELIGNVNIALEECAQKYEIKLTENSISQKFRELLPKLYKAKGKVVVIIDEYDKALLDSMEHKEEYNKIKDELKGFYEVLKGCDQYLKFVFMTGITKFSQVSLFSGLNQPQDISFDEQFCSLCGITQEELEGIFAPEIEQFKDDWGGKEKYLEKLKNFYNGYRFSDSLIKIYNPISIMKHFNSNAKFLNFWAETGTPSFLARHIKKYGSKIDDIENIELESIDFGKYDEESPNIIPLMYQAGYLTIVDYNKITNRYKLNYPNLEVRNSFANFLSDSFSGVDKIMRGSMISKLVNSLIAGDGDNFVKLLIPHLAKIDYSLIAKISEYYFEFAISNIINMLGINCKTEVHTAEGSVDAIVEILDFVYIMEFKKDKSVNSAMRQIEQKNYALQFEGHCKNIVKIGVKFSSEKKNIVAWKVKK